jgi:DNA-binding response OmpR family regulator
MRILVVEDDPLQGATLVQVLTANQYDVEAVRDGQAGLACMGQRDYDLILLDVQIPKLDGLSLCQHLRSQGYRKPILLMTANDGDAAAVAGFEAGADDYLIKPLVTDVLLARIRTWMRRSAAQTVTQVTPKTAPLLIWGNLAIDQAAGRVTLNGQVVPLTATEYNLLELFLRHPDRIFSRSAILDQLWEFDDAPTDRAIVTHVKDVRKKLRAGGLRDEIIETVYGMGYRLKPAPPVALVAADAPVDRPVAREGLADPVRRDALVSRLRGVLMAQVAVLVRAKAALEAGFLSPDLHQAARQEAHKLAGSLASFGYPMGSTVARSLEHLLLHAQPFSSNTITQICDRVTALHQELATPPHETLALAVTTPPRQVFVIDDDTALTECLKGEAANWNVRLQVMTTVAAARSQLALERPDLILLDLSFPATEDDGMLLLQEITRQFPQLPVMVFTGRDSLHDRLAVLRLGARQFLPKPASVAQIFQAIARVLAQPTMSAAKVLIVDDDQSMLALLSGMLSPWGVAVEQLSDPQQFWQVLVTTAPDLVLLDLEMPGITGLELCQVVRQDAAWGDLPILVVTAHTDATALQQAFAAGADDFIAKPVLGPELVTRVLSRIERQRGRREGRVSRGGRE